MAIQISHLCDTNLDLTQWWPLLYGSYFERCMVTIHLPPKQYQDLEKFTLNHLAISVNTLLVDMRRQLDAQWAAWDTTKVGLVDWLSCRSSGAGNSSSVQSAKEPARAAPCLICLIPR